MDRKVFNYSSMYSFIYQFIYPPSFFHTIPKKNYCWDFDTIQFLSRPPTAQVCILQFVAYFLCVCVSLLIILYDLLQYGILQSSYEFLVTVTCYFKTISLLIVILAALLCI